jgi:lipopolysaccharide biosynthesis glycosyltransferase
MTRQTVPILTCFDDNYVIPAAVAFHTLAATADPAHRYVIYVAHSDISPAHQQRLTALVADGPAEVALVFLDVQHEFAGLFERTRGKGHYSKEMFYKLLAPSLIPQHDRLLVTDVDVMFSGDVSRDVLAFDVADDIYLAGSPSLVRRGSQVDRVSELYVSRFTPEERARLVIGAGYYVVNLARMRADGIEQRLLAFAHDNAHRLMQPEQDTLNLVCHPRIRLLPADSMVCTYAYDFYTQPSDLSEDLHYSAAEVRHALDHPVQLHFAGGAKPWTHPSVTCSERWYAALAQTGFLRDQLERLDGRIETTRRQKVLASVKVPFSRRTFVLSKYRG